MERIIYVGGGAMAGVFSGGVVTGLAESQLLDKFDSIYAGSAGLMNVCYASAGQARQGATIYFEDLCTGFIKPENIITSTTGLLRNKLKGESRPIDSVVDVDHLFSTVLVKKPLDLSKIGQTSIYAKLFDIDANTVEYVNICDTQRKDDVLATLKAAVAITPYYPFPQTIRGKRYVDGTIKEPIGFQKLRKQHPDAKILVVVNEPVVRGVRHIVKNTIEGAISSCIHPNIRTAYFQREAQVRQDFEMIHHDHNALLIHPPETNRVVPKTTNPQLLHGAFKKGLTQTNKIKQFFHF